MSEAKDTPVEKFMPLHDVFFPSKVVTFTEDFNPKLAVPILVDEYGGLLNGTHRYAAFLKRREKGLEPNFTFVYMEDLEGCWVGEGLRDILEDPVREYEGNTFIDLDHFWKEHWIFSAPFCNQLRN